MQFNMNSNKKLYRNQSIIMLGNQTDNIDNVSVEVNFISLFESNAWYYKRLKWWPRIGHILYVTLRLLNSLIEYVEPSAAWLSAMP
jgi:hypothetical protein